MHDAISHQQQEIHRVSTVLQTLEQRFLYGKRSSGMLRQLYCAIHIHMATPTSDTYAELQTAVDVFNKELFGGQLPHCLITLQRRPRTAGYMNLPPLTAKRCSGGFLARAKNFLLRRHERRALLRSTTYRCLHRRSFGPFRP